MVVTWRPAGFEGVLSISSVLSIMKPDIRVLRPKTFQCKKGRVSLLYDFFNWNMSALKNFENHDNNFTHRIQKKCIYFKFIFDNFVFAPDVLVEYGHVDFHDWQILCHNKCICMDVHLYHAGTSLGFWNLKSKKKFWV